MAGFMIIKNGPLNGEVIISGAKNAALPALAASLLTKDEVVLRNIPDLSDITNFCELLKSIGAKISSNMENSIKVINASDIYCMEGLDIWACRLRASFLILGPLLARCGKAVVPMPGGCAIGNRPVDLHLKGFEAMGARIGNSHGSIYASTDGKLQGCTVYLDFPSVGATENLMMAATLAEGSTILENAAVEPEIVDLANLLHAMGARINGAGTPTIRINGVTRLNGTDYSIIPDRIEAGTFMLAAAATRGNIVLRNVIPEHLKPVTAKLRECGLELAEELSSIRIEANREIRAVDIKTYPYPGFPTDMQAPAMALLCTAEGTSLIVETVFENRFLHAAELQRMGGNVKVEGRSAIVEGRRKLSGTKVCATDLRAGAALIIAGLAAEGITEIVDNGNIDRGYVNIDRKLQELGADIQRVSKRAPSSPEEA